MMIKEFKRTGGPIFPTGLVGGEGLTIRDYFAAHAPAPTPEQIQMEGDRDRLANPHGDSYKPKRRSALEIIVDLRYAFADAMIVGRE